MLDFVLAVGMNDAVIIDVRPPSAYRAGHLPRAINIDLRSEALADHVARLNSRRPYAVYGGLGSRPAAMVAYLRKRGFTRLYLLEGGIGAWMADGREVVPGP